MSFPHETLKALPDRADRRAAPPRGLPDAAEFDLVPLVRCVLRTGCGLPELVQWVRRTLPQVTADADRGRPVDPDRVAPPLARLLSATLRRGRAAAADTQVGV